VLALCNLATTGFPHVLGLDRMLVHDLGSHVDHITLDRSARELIHALGASDVPFLQRRRAATAGTANAQVVAQTSA
jgi:hypothetical protein